MSVVDLLASDVWSDADILNRTEAMVRSEFSAAAETILNRKIQGAAMGIALSAEDQAEVMRFQGVVLAAQQAGIDARADMVKLQAVLDYEAALARLDQPLYEGDATVLDGEGKEIPNPLSAQDADERAAAQAVIDVASAETLDLYALRHPPEPAQEPEELGGGV